MTEDYEERIQDSPVVTLTVEQPDSDDLWFEIKLPITRAIINAAIKELHRHATEAADTTTLDWDDIDVRILEGCLREYQLYRMFEDKAKEMLAWLEAVPSGFFT